MILVSARIVGICRFVHWQQSFDLDRGIGGGYGFVQQFQLECKALPNLDEPQEFRRRRPHRVVA